MKKKLLLFSFLFSLTGIFIYEISYTNPSQPPIGYCGINGATCGESSCHNVNPDVGSGNVKISCTATNGEYFPDSTYSVTVKVTQSGISRFGFEMALVDANNKQLGTLTRTNTSNTSSQVSGATGKTYVGHKNANSNNTWTLKWKAPSKGKGKASFYAAGMAANNNGNETGDEVYTDLLELKEHIVYPAGIETIAENNFYYIYVMNEHAIKIYSKNNQLNCKYELYNVDGKNILCGNTISEVISIPSHLHGLYIMNIYNGEKNSVLKILIP